MLPHSRVELETGRLRELHTESRSSPAPLADKNQKPARWLISTPPALGTKALAAVPQISNIESRSFRQSSVVAEDLYLRMMEREAQREGGNEGMTYSL